MSLEAEAKDPTHVENPTFQVNVKVGGLQQGHMIEAPTAEAAIEEAMRRAEISITAAGPTSRVETPPVSIDPDAQTLTQVAHLVRRAYANSGLEFDSLRKIGDLLGVPFHGGA